MDIQTIIQQKLNEIEQAENVTILHAVESGSRAWGFASPDSDYDVRFVYVRRRNDYLRLEKYDDVIEWQLDETLDINGWDLQKALRLLHKSNPTLFEWHNSPIVYRTTDYWQQTGSQFNALFSCKAGIYHYLNMAKSNTNAYLGSEKVKLKKYFYVLRPVLAAKWILERKCPPPVLFSELSAAMLDDALRPCIDELLQKKAQTSELGMGERIPILHDYLMNSIAELDARAAEIVPEQNCNWNVLDQMFLDGIAFGMHE